MKNYMRAFWSYFDRGAVITLLALIGMFILAMSAPLYLARGPAEKAQAVESTPLAEEFAGEVVEESPAEEVKQVIMPTVQAADIQSVPSDRRVYPGPLSMEVARERNVIEAPKTYVVLDAPTVSHLVQNFLRENGIRVASDFAFQKLVVQVLLDSDISEPDWDETHGGSRSSRTLQRGEDTVNIGALMALIAQNG